MALGGVAELLFGVRAEGVPLENIAKPLTVADASVAAKPPSPAHSAPITCARDNRCHPFAPRGARSWSAARRQARRRQSSARDHVAGVPPRPAARLPRGRTRERSDVPPEGSNSPRARKRIAVRTGMPAWRARTRSSTSSPPLLERWITRRALARRRGGLTGRSRVGRSLRQRRAARTARAHGRRAMRAP
jgi:hypothetical protein